MEIYESLRSVPEEAKKTIQGGRLKGFTDINPMWRIKKLTEVFGPCGFGWYIEEVERWTEDAGQQKAAFVKIHLYVQDGKEWSRPIVGIGGSSLVSVEKSGSVFFSDEAYKMAYTDAISVACKALGMAADVYFEKDRTKYDVPQQPEPVQQPAKPYKKPLGSVAYSQALERIRNGELNLMTKLLERFELTLEQRGELGQALVDYKVNHNIK
ncbi:MAG: hypothetical protein NC115_12030 [Bacteroidales bacterium]|nr:hypothetical protein [Bacteroidales bacterium]